MLYEAKIKSMGNAGRNGGEYYIDPKTFDLSVKNPNGGAEIAYRSPQEIMKGTRQAMCQLW